MQDLSDFRYFAGGRDRGGGLFRAGLSGGAFGWDFRVGLSGGARGLRQQAQVVFAAGKRGFRVGLSGTRKMSARSRCLRSRETRGRHFSGREDFVSRITLSSQEHLYMGIVVQGKCWETRGQRQGGARSTGLGGIVYFATGICSFCWVLRGRSAGYFAGDGNRGDKKTASTGVEDADCLSGCLLFPSAYLCQEA